MNELYDVELSGCTATPLMAYLKTLGVFRIVSEQADSHARLSWRQGVARLHSRLNRASLVDFFLREYSPTPILAPWNGGSGFYDGGAAPLEAIEQSTTDRLETFRRTIAKIRKFVPSQKPKEDAKIALLDRCRAELDDCVVPWLDACFVLGENSASYFPLLGTGGNDGRLDFTNNFFQRLADVMAFNADDSPPQSSAGWIASTLFRDSFEPLQKTAIGQFHPGGIGGANGVQGSFEANARVNPWDYVLMLEGSLLFAGAAVRRLGASSSRQAAFPFCVQSVAVGYGSATASEETTDGSRAELWMPQWNRGARLGEVRQLFAEGRAQLGRAQARNGLEFALAASLLGVNRGVESFERYGIHKRNGLAYLATPLGRFHVAHRPRANLLLDYEFTRWHQRLRTACGDKSKTPLRYQSALRAVDQAVFEFTTRSETGDRADRFALGRVLRALGRAEKTLSRGIGFAESKYLNPLAGLSDQWLTEANDGSVEFRLALSLAGIQASERVGGRSFREYLEPVAMNRGRFTWDDGSVSHVWRLGELVDNLIAVFDRRLIELSQGDAGDDVFPATRFAQIGDVLMFLRGGLGSERERRLEEYLWGLCCVGNASNRAATNVATIAAADIKTRSESSMSARGHATETPPYAFGLLRLLASPNRIIAKTGRWEVRVGGERLAASQDSAAELRPRAEVFAPLRLPAHEQVVKAVERAASRYAAAGLTIVGRRCQKTKFERFNAGEGLNPRRLLASLLFPLSPSDLGRLADLVLFPND